MSVSVEEALKFLRKLEMLQSDGAKLMYLRNFLEKAQSGTAHGILGVMAEVKANQQKYCPSCGKPKMNCDCAYEGEK